MRLGFGPRLLVRIRRMTWRMAIVKSAAGFDTALRDRRRQLNLRHQHMVVSRKRNGSPKMAGSQNPQGGAQSERFWP